MTIPLEGRMRETLGTQGNVGDPQVLLQGNYRVFGRCSKWIGSPEAKKLKAKVNLEKVLPRGKKVVRDRRCGEESGRNGTVRARRGDGSFVTVRLVCFPSLRARTRSANQPPPPPRIGPPITIHPPTSASTCPRCDLWR